MSFHEYFKTIPADTTELRNEVFRIRYDVYCEELGYEDTERFPDKLEQDSYDPHSQHCLLWHKSSEQFAGCVRLAQASPELNNQKLPFELTCGEKIDRSIVDISQLPTESYGEISRLAVRSTFRRRAGEKNTPFGVVPDSSLEIEERRSFPLIAFGLYLAAAASGLNNGLERVFAMMEPRLARRLRIFGINFEQIGEPIEHRGLRAPYQITEEGLYSRMPEELKLLLDDIRQDVRIKNGGG
jgi:N-acyl amino acid synthase of PEP-CTERM/exosortase system